MTRRRPLLTATFLVLCLAAPISAQGPETACWTAVGSGGTPDDADLEQFTTNLNAVGIRSAISSAQVLVRYNITAVDGLLQGSAKQLSMRYTDNGDNARVVARVRSINVNTGSGVTLAELDSDDFPSSASAQTQTLSFNCDDPALDFSTNAYYVEVTLIKTATSGAPALRALRICSSEAC
jgi:hypothetical protein